MNSLLSENDGYSVKCLPLPEDEESFVLTILRKIDGVEETFDFSKCLRWKYHPFEDMMQFLIIVAEFGYSHFEAQSTQWLWSRIVLAYCNLIRHNRIRHDDMKFDNLVLECDIDPLTNI